MASGQLLVLRLLSLQCLQSFKSSTSADRFSVINKCYVQSLILMQSLVCLNNLLL